MILYEYPFNERIRTYLRLEHLLHRLGYLLERKDALDHHFALMTLFDTMDMIGRVDVKTDLLKDLENQKAYLASQRDNPAIAQDRLETFAGYVEHAFAALKQQHGKPLAHLADNDWLMSVRSRVMLPGATCSFDHPGYHAWQHAPVAKRASDLARWAASLQPLSDALNLLLRMLRSSGTPQMAMAERAQFQQALPQGRVVQLIRLQVSSPTDLIPEISGNRMLVSIRFMQSVAEGKPQPAECDVLFEMALCS